MNGPKGSIQLPWNMRNGSREMMRDQTKPDDLQVHGTFEDGELTKVSMHVSLNEKTGKFDEIEYDAGGKLLVNGKEVSPPLTTENGTKITSDGGKISVETAGGDHFSFESTICPAINFEGSLNPNRGTDAVRSDLFGNFDDDPNSTWIAKNDADRNNGVASGGGAGGVAGDGAGSLGSSFLDDLFESLRKTFSSMATAGTGSGAPSVPADAAGFVSKIKDPELKAAVLDSAFKGGIDVDKLMGAISSPADKEKVLMALGSPGTSLEDTIKMISDPDQRKAFLAALVGPDKVDSLYNKLFAS